MKAQHQQVEVDRSRTLTEFIKEDEIKLKPGERYDLMDMAVTSDYEIHLYLKLKLYYIHRCKFCPFQ
jgi:hypothetical protein